MSTIVATPWSATNVQSPGQSTCSEVLPTRAPVTLPPVAASPPFSATRKVRGTRKKVAVTLCAAVMGTVHVAPLGCGQPDQERKVDVRVSAVAVRTIVSLPWGALRLQKLPQLISSALDEASRPATVPLPLPALTTSSVRLTSSKLAVTLRASVISTVQLSPVT